MVAHASAFPPSIDPAPQSVVFHAFILSLLCTKGYTDVSFMVKRNSDPALTSFHDCALVSSSECVKRGFVERAGEHNQTAIVCSSEKTIKAVNGCLQGQNMTQKTQLQCSVVEFELTVSLISHIVTF